MKFLDDKDSNYGLLGHLHPEDPEDQDLNPIYGVQYH
jgi:hypothetical protein